MVWAGPGCSEMGNPQSAPQKEAAAVPAGPNVALYHRLYSELNAPDHAGAPAIDKMFKNRFENYFGGPYLELGHLLYHKLFGEVLPVDEEMFLSAMTLLGRLSLRDGGGEVHETEAFYFTLFSGGSDSISREALVRLLHVSATFALVVGSELQENAALPKDHYLLQAIADSAMVHADGDKKLLHKVQFALWASGHHPRLMQGMQFWLKSLLHTSPHGSADPQTQAAAPQATAPQATAPQATAPQATAPQAGAFYQLPVLHVEAKEGGKRAAEMYPVVWALSTVLPLIYLGHKEPEKSGLGHPVGGAWTLLYASDSHGFSMNRFQHHCSDYREPSVALLRCRQHGVGGVVTLAIAMDTEWRDGTYFYGGDNFCFLELRPTFQVIRTGPKLLSLNEKQRGFPTGLRVMSSDKYTSCLLRVDSSLDNADYQGMALDVVVVEVWGCGGVGAADYQRRVKDWENKEILRRRKVKTSELKETWENSPDRLLLEMGGVSTRRPTNQQQQ